MAQEKAYPLAGHHNADPGAIKGNRKEAEEMKCFRDLVAKELQVLGVDFETDKDSETNTVLQSRIKPNKTDVIFDNHLDSSANENATGCGVFISDKAGAMSKQMALEAVNGLSEIYGIKNRGVKTESQTARGKIGILNKPGIAILIEHAFISNKSDMAAFDKNKVKAAKFVAQLIKKYDDLID